MEYWHGYMNAPLNKDWICPICSNRVLVWGFINGQCRCDICHTEFMMRDGTKVVDIPIWLIKDVYKEPAKAGYQYFKKPISEFSDEEWDYAFSLVGR